MKLEPRYQAVNYSLQLEFFCSRLLIVLFRIKKMDASHTLGSKGSSISFKTKVDFLYDLDRIDKDTYNDLLLFMEFRNQLIHNLESNSFLIAYQSIQRASKIFRLKPERQADFNNAKDDVKESILDELFTHLHTKLMESLNKIMDDSINEIQNELQEKSDKAAYELIGRILEESISEFAKIFKDAYSGGVHIEENIDEVIERTIWAIASKKLKDKGMIEG